MQSVLPKAVRELTQELSRLPSVGPKTAQRLALHLLRQPASVVKSFSKTLETLHSRVSTCSRCFSLSEEGELCVVCKNKGRDQDVLCVVESPLDVEAVEKTDTYNGLYHVLGGVLSPIEGIGLEQLTIDQLFKRLESENAKEIIIALGHTMESDATTRYIISGLAGKDISLTRLAQGLPTGGDIEFADASTLSAAFDGRKKL